MAQARSRRVAGFAEVEAAGVLLEHLQAPAEGGGEAERAVVVEPAVVEVVGGLAGAMQSRPSGWLGGGEELGHALVGEAVHADPAVGFGAGAEPGDGLGAVAGFVAEGVEVAFGVAAAADVLDDDVVAVAGEPDGVGVDDGGGDVAAVGLAHQERGVGPGCGGVVVVGDRGWCRRRACRGRRVRVGRLGRSRCKALSFG